MDFIKLRKRKDLQYKLVLRDLPYVYGLMAIAVSSGLSNEAALRNVLPFMPASVSKQMHRTLLEIDSGKSFVNALSNWEQDPNLRTFSHILMESFESGVSSLSALDSMARDANNKVRRNCETALKKLPVTMLFPLVTCILPAFILLSVVPTVADGLTRLS